MKWIYVVILFCLIAGCQNQSFKKGSINSRINPRIDASLDPKTDKLIIVGDFNGNGRTDTLRESVISTVDGKETNKYYQNISYDSAVSLTYNKKNICRLISKRLYPLTVVSGKWQCFGLAYLKNEGDLDGDGGDEVGLVIDWADWSNINTYEVYSYKHNSWKMLLSFEIRDCDIEEIKNNKDSIGLLYKDSNGNLIEKTYENAEQINKKISLKKK